MNVSLWIVRLFWARKRTPRVNGALNMSSLMKAWRLECPGGALVLKDIPVPEPRSGSVLVRIEVSALMSYLKGYVEGKLPFYNPPQGEKPRCAPAHCRSAA